MSPLAQLLTWLRTADAPLPRAARSLRREAARRSARRRHGTVTAYLDAVVAEANGATGGSSFPERPRPRPRARQRR